MPGFNSQVGARSALFKSSCHCVVLSSFCCYCVVLLFVLFYYYCVVLCIDLCTVTLPPGVNPIGVDKYIYDLSTERPLFPPLNAHLSISHSVSKQHFSGLNYLDSFLACFVPFKSSSLHFSPVCESSPYVLSVGSVLLRSMSSSVLIFCTSLPTFICSVLKIATFKPLLWFSSLIYVIFTEPSITCAT